MKAGRLKTETIAGSGELLETDAIDLFGFDKDAVGSLKVEADGSGLIGDVVFSNKSDFRYATALPLQGRTFTEAVFG